jgi:endonuclease/exonuclease/phosphatase family metal-dependent hydrolase
MSVYRDAGQVQRDTAQLRVVTLNLWGLSEPLTRRLDVAIAQLRGLDADVVCLQEVKPMTTMSSATTAHVIADALGMHTTYHQHTQWGDQAEGLAILSRQQPVSTLYNQLPESRMNEGRGLLSVCVATAHGPSWVHCTHLHYRLDDGIAREAQVLAIDGIVRLCGRDNDSAPQILCGDFNATADSDEIRFLRGLTSLPHRGDARRTHFQDAWLRLHSEPQRGDGPLQGITWSSENEHTRPLRSLDIDRRIDYIFVTSRKRDGRGTVHACNVVMTERQGDGADEVCASDHYGVMADIQIAANPA